MKIASWDAIMQRNICIMGITEGGKREKGAENILEGIIAEYFPNLGKETDIQVQQSQSPKQDKSTKENHIKTHCN